MTLTKVLPLARQLTVSEKLKLIRLLAEDLESDDATAIFEGGKFYNPPTPYDSYGPTQVLADALADFGKPRV